MKRMFIPLLCFVLLLSVLSACNGDEKTVDATSASTGKPTQAPTEPATEFSVVPASDEEIASFDEALIGKWISYSDQGVRSTYSFNKDGSLIFQKEGKDPAEYKYTFDKGLLTINNTKNTHVYQCSKDAVGMIARLHNGEYQTYFAKIAEEKIPDFGGCTYIVNDILYIGDKCMCKETGVNTSGDDSIVGDWIGAVGDEVSFAPDGKYVYLINASTYKGTYSVDDQKSSLLINIAGNSNDHDKTQWGIDGRVLHIGKQYYFKK